MQMYPMMNALFFTAAIDWEALGSGAWLFVVVTVSSFVVLTLVTSVVRFHQLTTGETEGDADSPGNLFLLRMARRMVVLRRNPPPFGLLLLAPGPGAGAVDGSGDTAARLQAAVQRLVRASDEVMAYGADRVGVIVEAERSDMPAVAERVRQALLAAGNPGKEGGLGDVRMACAAFPENGQTVQALMQAAGQALERALASPDRGAVVTAFEAREEPGEEGEKEDEVAPPAFVDPLTGVLKADRASQAVQKYIARHRSKQQPVALVLIGIDDLDRLEHLNGTEGSDQVLKGFADLLQRHLRADDLIGRWEHDGFFCAMEGSAEQGMQVVKRLVERLRKTEFQHQSTRLHVAASWGLAAIPEHARLPRQLIECAVLARDAAREKGRNSCVCFDPAMRVQRQRNEVPSDAL